MTFGRRPTVPATLATVRPSFATMSDVLARAEAREADRAWTGRSSNADTLAHGRDAIRYPFPVPAGRARRAAFAFLAAVMVGLAGLACAAYGMSHPVPFAGFDLVQVIDGEAYVVDSGLTGDDCARDLRAALTGFSCELPR